MEAQLLGGQQNEVFNSALNKVRPADVYQESMNKNNQLATA